MNGQKQLQKPEYKGIPLIFVFKLLIACISVAFFVLLAIFVELIFAGLHCDFSILEGNVLIDICSTITLICAGIFLAISTIYVLVVLTAKTDIIKKYDAFYQQIGIIFLALLFLCMGITFAVVIVNLKPNICGIAISILFTGALSFAPILASWWVDDEVRLKNFLDAVARVCTALTFIGGGCTFLLNQLLS